MTKIAENKHNAKGSAFPAWVVTIAALAALLGWWVAGTPNKQRATPPKLSDL